MAAQPIHREPPAEPGGIARLKVMDEVKRLQQMGKAALRTEAHECGVPAVKIRAAVSRDELRLAILERKIGIALGGDS